jgi:hypothetical protein
MEWRRASAAPLLLMQATTALADEGGASAWLPGQFASFAAVPGDPGFSLETTFCVRKATASAGIAFSRGGSLLAGIDVSEQYVYLTPSYTFEQPVLHGQLSLGLTFSAGRNDTSVFGVLSGPLGGSVSATRGDGITGVSDLYPLASLKWQFGRHNVMAYTMASAPIGTYDPNRLAGLGLGHWALDGGFGYTFLSASGFEASLVAGMTYNFLNPSTNYQSGMDGHLELAASYALSEQAYVGLAGYLYHQVSADTGGPLLLGEFRSRVAGAGPQVGWSFSAGRVAVDVNLRGYKEFAAQNRPEGWNAWLTVSLSAAKPQLRE